MARAFLVSAALTALLAVPAWAEQPASAAHPDGTGDPDAITCRPPQVIPGQRLPGPQVCKLNAQWALLRRNGQDIAANGRDIIPDPKGSNINAMDCHMQGGSATNGGGQMVCKGQ
jgi:cytochrome c